MARDATPFQTPPQLDAAAGLSDLNEYAVTWTGQSNSRPRAYPQDAESVAFSLGGQDTGEDITGIRILRDDTRTIGVRESLDVLNVLPTGQTGTTLTAFEWNTHTWLRLGVVQFAQPAVPQRGYAKIVDSRTSSLGNVGGTLLVEWESLPQMSAVSSAFFSSANVITWPFHAMFLNDVVSFAAGSVLPGGLAVDTDYYVTPIDTNTFSISATEGGSALTFGTTAAAATIRREEWTITGYAVHDPYPGFETLDPKGAKFYGYEHVRVLTPYMPVEDIRPPVPSEPGGGLYLAPISAPYRDEGGPLRTGRRFILPAPYAIPSAITDFEDVGLFLPLTRREGSHGYGISDVADATFPGSGDPVGHPIHTISGNVFTFANDQREQADLAGGYLLIDWEEGTGGAAQARRSWARITASTQSTFTVDPNSWLGDGAPAGNPPQLAVTFDQTTDTVTWTGHTFSDGDRVAFFGGTMPNGVLEGTQYVVANAATNTFQLRKWDGHPILDFTSNGSGVTGVQVWHYTAWCGHWRDNPYMWIPGPEFAMPNGDQQPHGPWCHWRARGQLQFNHMLLVEEPAASFNLIYNFWPFDGRSDGRFGAMTAFGHRVASALGKRINIVCLGINGTPLAPMQYHNTSAHPGITGWWDWGRYAFGVPLEDRRSFLADRLKRLITVVAPNALLAENNQKALQYLGSAHVQGEGDSITDNRELYGPVVTDYKRFLRDSFRSINAYPFTDGAESAFVQPLLTRDPWESGATGGFADFQQFNVDPQGDTNNAIRLVHTTDPFADYTITEDLPKLIFDKIIAGVNPPWGQVDNAHFGGEGMVWQGYRLAAKLLDLIEYALLHSSSATTASARLLRVANNALLAVGQGARMLVSLQDNTAEARVVRSMLPEAITQLLSMRSWKWAERIEPATLVVNENPNWSYAYVVPGRAISVTAILNPSLVDNYPPIEGSTTNGTTQSEGVFASVLPLVDRSSDFSQYADDAKNEFEIVRDASGNRILLCNVAPIPPENDTETSVANGEINSERLPTLPWLVYTDDVRNPNHYSDSFTTALTHYLASLLAPALIKGPAGERVASTQAQKAAQFIGLEAQHETRSERSNDNFRADHRPTWISER